MTHLGLFEGIGGFSLAARWIGWETVAWCEIDPFCQQVLKYHFPEATSHSNIKETDFTQYANKIDVLTGGFPCQPYSTAGKQLGTADDRHLWPEMLRTIREVKPTWVVGENVRGLVSWNGGLVFDQVQVDLETEGYEVQSFLLPAAGIGAPHKRYRIWFIAFNAKYERERSGFRSIQEKNGEISVRNYDAKSCNSSNGAFKNTDSNGRNGFIGEEKSSAREQRDFSTGNNEWLRTNDETVGVGNNPNSQGLQDGIQNELNCIPKKKKTFKGGKSSRAYSKANWSKFPTQPPVCSGDDGLRPELDGITFSKWREQSIKGFGNAIVPQLAFELFKVINELSIKPIKYATNIKNRL